MKSIHKFLFLILVCFSKFSTAQLPSMGGFTSAPDNWLLSKGPSWHYKTEISSPPAPLIFRDPTHAEKAVIQRATLLLQNSSAKSMALINGHEVVWVGYNGGTNDKSTFLGFSVGKTVASMAVGKAICSGKLSLKTVAEDIIPELKGTDLGKATVHNLLTMSSGTWEGNSDSTITSKKQIDQMNSGQLSILDVLRTPEIHSAHQSFFGAKRVPGEEFAYRTTDPWVLGVMINKVTGMSYVKWVEQQVLLPVGIESQGVIGQDKFGFGSSAGDVRLTLKDWIRFAVWVKQNETAQGCFGDFVREATKTQIANKSKRSGKLFDGYGYYVWTENLRLRDSYWANGHGGQRIGWNHKNKRMLIAFSNVENYMDDLYWLYRDWASLQD
jgi:CubicO group peptidase (beta-lactamase class C family)